MICSGCGRRFDDLNTYTSAIPTPLAYQKTRLQRCYASLAQPLWSALTAPWRRKAVVILALTGGFFCGQNINAVANAILPLDNFGAIGVMLIYELLVRLRGAGGQRRGFHLLQEAMDNFRVGFVFAFVLEAFKLGS